MKNTINPEVTGLRSNKSSLILTALAVAASCGISSAAISIVGTNTTGSYTPTTPIAGISNSDLADAASGATITNANTAGSANVGRVGNLIDGHNTISTSATVSNPGSVYFSDGSNAPDLLPSTQTITLNTSVNTLGYNLTSIVTYAGWHSNTGADLANQDYTISFSTVSAPTTFTSLATVSYRPFANGATASGLTTVTITENASPFLATNVAALRFTFNPNGNTTGVNGVVYNEIDVFGSAAVPEPSTAILGGLGVLGLLRRRRK